MNAITPADRKYIFQFLEDLSNNNSKDWMDANRKRYEQAKKLWLIQIQHILHRLAKHDELYLTIEPKKTISRITNNRMFHPEKPIYKEFFACEPAGKRDEGVLLFMAIGPNDCFIGGGFWKPEKEIIDQIREAIDYDGEELQRIIDSEPFQHFYGGLGEDPDKLKTSPQNYPGDHPHIELLRHKNFIAYHSFEPEEFFADSFLDLVEEAYLTIEPFAEYLKKALTVGA